MEKRRSYTFPGSHARIDRAWERRRAATIPLTPGKFVTHNCTGVIVSCGARGRGFGFIKVEGLPKPVFFCASYVDRSRGQSFDDLAVGDRVACRLHSTPDGRLEARDVTPVMPEDVCTS